MPLLNKGILLNLRLSSRLCALLLLCVLQGLAGPAMAGPLDLSSLHAGQSIVGQMQVLKESPGESLDRAGALAADRWQPATPDNIQSVLRRSTMWLKATVHNGSEAPIQRQVIVGYWRLMDVQMTLIEPATGRIVDHRQGGLLHRGDKKAPVSTVGSAFPLQLDPGESLQLVLRVHSGGWRTIDVDVWDAPSRASMEHRRFGLYSAVAGFSIALILILILSRRPLSLLLAAWLAVTLAYASANLGFLSLIMFPSMPIGMIVPLTGTLALWNSVLLLLVSASLLRPRKSGFWRSGLLVLTVLAFLTTLAYGAMDPLWVRRTGLIFPMAVLVAWPFLVVSARRGLRRVGVLQLFLLGLVWMLFMLRLPLFMSAFLVEYERFTYELMVYGQTLLVLAVIGKVAWKVRDRDRRLARWVRDLERKRRDRLESLVGRRTDQLEGSMLVAQEANAAKTKFLAQISHDLRAPLATIVGYARCLQTEPEPEGPGHGPRD